MQHLVEVQQT
jgi:protein-tyrosine-phosphatase